MSNKNQIKPIIPNLGNSKRLTKARANSGVPMFIENDLQMQGIIKETNNYPVNTNDCGDYDLDACNFILVAGIEDEIQKQAINTLVLSAKTNGWWDLCKAIYPMIGGTAHSCKFNLKDPRDANDAFRLGFTNDGGDPIFSSTGVQFNGLSFAHTYLIPFDVLTQNSTHISYYSRTQNAATFDCSIGVNSAGVQVFSRSLSMYLRYANGNFISDHYSFPNTRSSVSNLTSAGYFMSSRISSIDFRSYLNGNILTSNSNIESVSMPNTELYLGALNDGGSISWKTNRECAFATIGYGINNSIGSLMYNDIQTFQTTLGRQI